jgi:3-dehydroquinate synthase
LLINLGFEITDPLLQIGGGSNEILQGLQEFREHLGGRLTIMLLTSIGHGEEVHEMDISLLKQASFQLQNYQHEAL